MTYVKEDSCLCHLAELKSNIGKQVWILTWRYELALDQRLIIVIENLKKENNSYSPWNVLLFHLNGEWMVGTCWVNCELMLNRIWWALMNGDGEQTQSANRTQTQAKSEQWTHCKQFVNAIWTQDERLFGVPQELSLHYKSSVIRKNNK